MLTTPLDYRPFVQLVREARLVITDSGGIQEETTYLGIPCLTLRENTERPITISEGTNRLTTATALSSDLADALGQPPGHRSRVFAVRRTRRARRRGGIAH